MGSRGGIVARKAAEQRQRESVKYGLVGVKLNSVIAESLDKYGRWELGHRLGVLSTNVGNRVGVVWEGEEYPTMYTQAEARYKIDRSPPLWRVVPPHQRNIFDAMARADADRAASPPALTMPRRSESIASSPQQGAPLLTEEDAVPKQDEQPKEAAKTTPAKALARQLGVDPKVLRKFLRSGHSSFDPVGQGGRYEFTDDQVASISREWAQHKSGSTAKELTKVANGAPKEGPRRYGKQALPKMTDEQKQRELRRNGVTPKPKREDFSPIESMDEVEQDEPTDEDLAELEDLDLTLDDLED